MVLAMVDVGRTQTGPRSYSLIAEGHPMSMSNGRKSLGILNIWEEVEQYASFPGQLPGSKIVFETIGGSLAQGEQLEGSSSDWNVAQNFVSVKGKKGQIIMISDEVPL